MATNWEKWKKELTLEELCEMIDNDEIHKCDRCPIYDWCRVNSHQDDDSSCLDVFRKWAKAEAKED